MKYIDEHISNLHFIIIDLLIITRILTVTVCKNTKKKVIESKKEVLSKKTQPTYQRKVPGEKGYTEMNHMLGKRHKSVYKHGINKSPEESTKLAQSMIAFIE